MRDGKIGQNVRYYNIRGGTGEKQVRNERAQPAMQMKKSAQGGLLHFLAERTGLAYILQAAAARTRAALRVPPEAAQAASSTPQSRARKRA
ncbi:hypothetical protein, partial [Burkholderia sp. Bp9140]|uniref:hypothetical protein n=1 Tax=Burkholderia sp. Bp9140 TaxID=2184572 RepID=UPI001C8997B7